MKHKKNEREEIAAENIEKFEVDVFVKAEEYTWLARDIAANYFNGAGEYSPEIGFLHELLVFYTMCVTNKPFGEIDENTDALAFANKLASDEEYMAKFVLHTEGKIDGYSLQYSDARDAAYEIIEQRNRQNAYGISSLIAKVTEFLSSENVAKIAEIADALKSGELDGDKIVEKYGNSERAQRIINE